MAATTHSTSLVPVQLAFTDSERLAVPGFLAGYRGLTREAYALDLRQFTSCCRARCLNLFAVRRADIESFARDLEARGRARATVTRRAWASGRNIRRGGGDEGRGARSGIRYGTRPRAVRLDWRAPRAAQGFEEVAAHN